MEVLLEKLLVELAAIVAQLLLYRLVAWVRALVERSAGDARLTGPPPAIA